MKLKMCSTGKIFDKICLKAIRDTFFQYVVCNQRKVGVRHEEKGGDPIFLVRSDIQQRDKVQTFEHEWGEPSPVSPLVENSVPP